ncbi:hypothetical protein L596_022225 [Steinernema carpocapsae]|uniref:Uncharacterized protein n=1 Tax=Steinernema carpocapsae TaxID=34508 RepID=A0A4U5ML24_STECR|nr:hypothetical protein L596_022225 [Steinernema carpocapsae]
MLCKNIRLHATYLKKSKTRKPKRHGQRKNVNFLARCSPYFQAQNCRIVALSSLCSASQFQFSGVDTRLLICNSCDYYGFIR